MTPSEESAYRWRPATAAQRAALDSEADILLFGGSAPHAGLLVGGQGEVQARLERVTPAADPLGRLDLVDGWPGRPDGEEEIGLGTATGSQMAPVTVVPFDRTVPHKGHDASSAPVPEISCL